LSDCISDTAGRRESMGGQMTIPDNVTGEQRKASVVVRRPSMMEIHENACRISSAIDDIIAERYKLNSNPKAPSTKKWTHKTSH